MCLDPSWFDEADKRKTQRDQHGVTLKEAIQELQHARSTVFPIAEEMAIWLYHNWTLEQFMQLPAPNRDYVMRVVEKEFSYPGVREDRRKRREARRNPIPPVLRT